MTRFLVWLWRFVRDRCPECGGKLVSCDWTYACEDCGWDVEEA